MALHPGDALDHYEILGPLGAGGMGEVYRALDRKLKREVAIKVLPPHFAADSGRLARFQREAQLLASLNHPNIAAIYGLEFTHGVHFLVMELVEGQTIAERLAAKPMEVTEALRFAVQIADALQAAHEKGIIHRDLKPANVKITPEGKIKVLDFGLAKALDPPQDAPADPDNSPTITMGETRAGVVLGTAAYMSPEQASGQPVDKRADIWGFGVLLFEMLSGKRAFTGKTTSHILVKVLEHPPDWNALPPLPAGVRDLLERCLQKEASSRLRDIGDIGMLLESAITRPVEVQQARHSPKARRWLWPGFAAAGALVVIGYVYLRPAPSAPANAVRFELSGPGDAPAPIVRVSPDGTKIVFMASTGGSAQLWVRPLQSANARVLEGTEGVVGIPFWTPDSRFLIFTALGKLRKIDVNGGPAQYLADELASLGGLVTDDGRILYATELGGLKVVPAAGGRPTPFLGDALHQRGAVPAPLPGGQMFLFSRRIEGGIYLGSFRGEEPRQILPDSSPAAFAPSPSPDLGYVLFVRGSILGNGRSVGTLMAQPIDPNRWTLKGDPIPLAEKVPAAGFSVSNTGVLAYATGGDAVPVGIPGIVQGRLNWLDRGGRVEQVLGDAAAYRKLALAPDGKQVAMEIFDAQGTHLSLFEFSRGVTSRFTFERLAYSPVWSPDGRRIAYGVQQEPTVVWYVKNADRSGAEAEILRSNTFGTPYSWSPDGRTLMGNTTFDPVDLIAVDLAKPGESFKVTDSPSFSEVQPSFSPDGNWYAYASTESGSFELYVRPWDRAAGRPASGGVTLVSKGGSRPGGAVWRGNELFYLRLDGMMMAVDVRFTPTFSAGTPKELFKVNAPTLNFFSVSGDGKRFLMPLPDGSPAMMAPFTVEVNWTSRLPK